MTERETWRGPRGRRARQRLALVAGAAALVAAVTPLAACGPSRGTSDAGPTPGTGVPTSPPAHIAPAPPGTLVSAAPVEPAPADGVAGWKIFYHTRDEHGADVVATGAVLVPAGGTAGAVPAGGRPVVAFGHGTTGVADGCAPSVSPPALYGYGATFDQVRAGFVVAGADYIGLGGPGEHAIYLARPEGTALLDVARAARALPAARAGNRVIVWGYSQGGQAALAAGALAAGYAPELDLRGVVAMAPLADLRRSLRTLEETQGGVAYELLAAYGVSVADPTVGLDADLTPLGRQLLATARAGCAMDLLAAATGVTEDQVFLHDPLTTEPYASVLAGQRTALIAKMAPVLMLQGDIDDVIQRPITDDVVRDLCAEGTMVDYHRYAIASHSTIFMASAADMSVWIRDRFADTPAAPHDLCLQV